MTVAHSLYKLAEKHRVAVAARQHFSRQMLGHRCVVGVAHEHQPCFVVSQRTELEVDRLGEQGLVLSGWPSRD